MIPSQASSREGWTVSASRAGFSRKAAALFPGDEVMGELVCFVYSTVTTKVSLPAHVNCRPPCNFLFELSKQGGVSIIGAAVVE